MTKSARLFLPLLAPGQAQKEITHNEALAQLDIITQAVVQAVGVDVLPASPAPGECWIIGPSPEGSWSGMAQHRAGGKVNGWRFVQPFNGLGVWHVDEGLFARWDGGAWVNGIVWAAALRLGGEQISWS